MFAVTINPDDLQSAFDPVHALVDECKLHITEEGVTVTAVDPANVGMVDMGLPEPVFKAYEATTHTIGIPLERFLDIISLFGETGEPAYIMLNEQTRKLRMESGGLDYTLSLIDPDSIRKEPKIPDLNLTANATLSGKQFTRAVNACGMVADHIRIGATPEGEFFAKAEGDTDSVDFTMDSEELLDLDPGEADSLFNLEYLKDMEKAIPDGVEVTVEIGMEFPILITYRIIDSNASVQYMLAPRIQSG